jgi:hypothetical protein
MNIIGIDDENNKYFSPKLFSDAILRMQNKIIQEMALNAPLNLININITVNMQANRK